MRLVVAALTVSLLLAACGGRAERGTPEEWRANANGVVAQLRADVLQISAVDRLPAARTALRGNDAQLYVVLVAFSDIGGCDHMVASLGSAPASRRRAVTQLEAACMHLRAASHGFTRSVARSQPAALAAAAREALAALPPLDHAALALRR